MWLHIIIRCILWMHIAPAFSHHPDLEMQTGDSKADEYCDLADTCIHDTIPVCGRMGDETRSFLDLCDLIEFGCDTNQLYVHIDDIKDCPVFPKKKN